MCCHNGESFVAEQLRSILAQRRAVDVVHVHDFASTDGTLARLESAAQASTVEVHLNRHPDAPGASLSFFRALAILSPLILDEDVVFLADQDDVWLPNKTEVVLRELARQVQSWPGEHAIFHDVQVVGRGLELLRATYYTGDPFAVPRDLDPRLVLLSNPVIGHTLAVTGSLIRRVLRMARPDRYLMHDWSLVLFASRFGRICCIPEALSLYRQHEANVLGAYGRRGRLETVGRISRFSDEVVQQAIAFIHDTASDADRMAHVSPTDRQLFRLARRFPWIGYPVLALQALLLGPTIKRKGLGVFIALQGVRRSLGLGYKRSRT
jgi:rhamnosyltransferase